MAEKSYWGANAIDTPPELSELTSFGYPTNGNPAKGIPPTTPKAAWFHLIEQARVQLIKAAGQEPGKDDTQFLEALKTLLWLPDGKVIARLLAANSVTTDKVANEAISFAKLNKSSVATVDDVLNKVAQKIVSADVLAAALSQTVPPGTISMYAGRTVPEGWLVCNGATYRRDRFPRLFAAIGTIYGAGDGSTTFAVPNIDQRFFEATTNTAEVGKMVEAGLPNITGELHGDLNESGHGIYFNAYGAFREEKVGVSPNSIATYKRDFLSDNFSKISLNASRSNDLYGKSALVQPNSVKTLPIIKI